MKSNFTGMDEHSSRFYSAVFSNVMLNLYAVQRGWFDTLICDADDPLFSLRWRQSIPVILEKFRQHKKANGEQA